MSRLRADPRLRVTGTVAIGLVAWVVAQTWAPTWLALIVGLAAGSLTGLVLQRIGPRAIERVGGVEPVHVSIEPDASRLRDCWSVRLDGDLAEGGRPIGVDSLAARDWLVAQGAADADETYLKLVIEGRSSSTVRLRNVRALVERMPAMTRTNVTSPAGGDTEIQAFGLDLDEADPIARVLRLDPRHQVHVRPPFGAPYFSARQATVMRGEFLTYAVLARSTRDCVEWTLELEFVVDGMEDRRSLDNRGQPFRTTPAEPPAHQEWDWAWYESPEPRFVDVTERNRELRESDQSQAPPPAQPGPE